MVSCFKRYNCNIKIIRSAIMKIYHAHGFVVRNNFPAEGEEIWNCNSSFCKVFGDFERAKNYLLDCFERRLESIYANDGRSSPGATERREIKDKNSSWRREYIDEYIFYQLLISEIDSDIWGNERSKDMPDEVVWHIRYNGEISSRYLVFGYKEYEFRSSDEAEGSGKKFKAGDIVRLTDWEDERSRDLFVVYKTPQPAKEGEVWQNHYTVLGVGLYGRVPVVSEEGFHEADLELCSSEDLEHYSYGEQLIALQKVVTGKVLLPEEIWNKILHGRIMFNTCPSWRDIPELFRENSGK